MRNAEVPPPPPSTAAPRHHAPTAARVERPARTDFLCRVKYSNTLPDIPFDTKFLTCPLVSLSRFTDYKLSSLEKNFKFDVFCEPDCGVHIDLIRPETYYVDRDAQNKHHPTDLELLEDEQTSQQNLRRSLQHCKMVPWMRKTEYISSEFTRFGVSAERQETKVGVFFSPSSPTSVQAAERPRIGYSTKKKFLTEVLYRDRASQIAAINKTFVDASKPVLHHPTKKNVKAVEEFPLLPDFDNWMHPFALVIFDGDPIPQSARGDAQRLMPQALIRYEYNSVRDYNWLVRNKSTKGYEQDIFLFSFRDGAVYYNELETRVSLNRRKTKRARVIRFISVVQKFQLPTASFITVMKKEKKG
ncbi:unnamed protein product [Gongylonema pulchrum]|uniref:RNA polymerase II-associated factor 1 homolog n=1 Tax=Gongylonema pulchrum TaxID=637853 RepID=A0A183E1T8_9BILA|nr:unnamed protein product [Gongylonema pulchrum]